MYASDRLACQFLLELTPQALGGLVLKAGRGRRYAHDVAAEACEPVSAFAAPLQCSGRAVPSTLTQILSLCHRGCP